MDLSGRWRATEADDELRRTWLDDDVDDASWETIDVPGHWRSHPAFTDSNGPILHRTRFTHPEPEGDERLWLVLDGAFYQSDVWLDGAYVGDTEGYFFPHGFEVTDVLRARTDHVLGVELTCSTPGDLDHKRNLTGAFQHSRSIDPATNPGGLWRPVRIERSGPVRIRHLRVVCARATEEQAIVRVRAVLDAAEAGTVLVTTETTGVTVTAHHELAAGENQITWTVEVDDPDLWWPRSLGPQNLHDVTVSVSGPIGDDHDGVDADDTRTAGAEHPIDDDSNGDSDDDDSDDDGDSDADDHDRDRDRDGDSNGVDDRDRDHDRDEDHDHQISDTRSRRIGLRQVDMRDWVMSVNGERLYLKGATHLPTRTLLGEATDDEVRADVDRAIELGCDMVRIHSHIAHPALYDAADEVGLLLWQDLPLHGGYARTIRKEAVRQAREAVDLLAHHPSIAVWCAHDEPHHVERTAEAATPSSLARRVARQQVPSWNAAVLDRSLKRALQREDGSRPVIAHSGVLPHPPKLDGTDAHLRFGWGDGDERRLVDVARMMPRLVRFVSQLGPDSVPLTDDFIGAGLWPALDWPRLDRHHGLRRDRFDAHVPPGAFGTYEAWADATRSYQARVVRRQVEELRRLKYRPTGGVLVHTLTDPGPAVTGSLLDHRRVPKPAWESVRAALAPVIVVADRLPARPSPGDALALDVHVVNDRRDDIEGAEVVVRASWPGGGHGWRFWGDVGADSVTRIATVQLIVPDAPGTLSLDITLTDADGDEVATNTDEATIRR